MNTNNLNIKDTFMFRHACSLFDKDKLISDSIMDDILLAGRLSPSSFGLEPWRFIVIKNKSLQEEMEPLCYNQPQISSSSHIVAIIGREDFKENDTYIDECVDRLKENQDKVRKTIKTTMSYNQDIKSWASKQCYIAGANMMTVGAIKGVDSCPMEGFIPDKIAEFLELKDFEFPSLLIPFGYRAKEPREKIRWCSDKIIEYR